MKNKKLLTGMLATVLSVSMLCSNANMLQAQETTQASEIATQTEDEVILNDETGIPDKNLYNAILETADNNGDGVLTVSEAELVTKIWVWDAGVQNLQGIQYCKNLETLSLNRDEDDEKNQISDITPLAGLLNLKSLSLSGNQINDISALAGLLNLKSLSLGENQISDISSLAEMENLESVELAGNQIKDVSALTGKNLWCLDLSHNPLDENAIDVISNIVSIEELYLAGTQLTNEDVKKLANLNRLAGFDLSDNQISDISSLDNIWKYVYLIDLSNNQISDVSVLAGLGGTACRFDLSYNQISDVTPLADNHIHLLNLSNNQISEFPLLHSTWQLDLSNNQISNITLLAGYTGNLVDLSNNQISELVAFGWINNLNLSGNQIKNISVLETIAGDEEYMENWSDISLNLSNNQITDITPLTDNPILTDTMRLLDLSNNKIRDITSFETAEFSNLCELDLSNNNIRDISALEGLKEIEMDGSPCKIITDGNPIGEPEVPTEPEEPSEPEKPSEPEQPSKPEVPSEPEKPTEPEQPIYNADDFAELLETQDIVVKPNDYVTITFEKGSKLNDTNGKTEFDFTTTITTDFTNAKLPTFITENSFITKVSYTYSGVLPSTANIKIFVGTEYAGKEVFYFLLNEDGTFNKDEVQKVKVNEDGSIIVTQEHCSDYVVTTENPETLYKATQTPEQPKDENTNNTENNENTSNDTTKEESPKTSDNSQFVLLSIMMISLSAFVVLARKIYKRA